MQVSMSRVLWALTIALTLSCNAGPSEKFEAAQSRQAIGSTVAAQFLTLPMHPRQEESSEEGLIEFENRFIWRAPLENGLPPGISNGPQVEAAQPSPLAARAGGGTGTQVLVNASNAADSYQGETGAAANGTSIVGGSNSIFPGACGTNPCFVRSYTSGDGGTSYSTASPGGTWNGTTFGITFDPAIDFDTSGNYFYVFGGAPLSGSFPNSIAVASAGPSGLSWSTPVAVTFNKNRFFDDKYYLAVDRSASTFRDRIYVGWDRNQQNNQILFVSFSSTHGASWSSPVKVNDGTSRFERVIGAYPAVDHRNGTVLMSWHDYARNQIFVDRSTNGGVSWGTDVLAAITHTGFGMDIGCNGGRSQSPAHHLKVGPSGTLHLVYADNVAGRGFDILYVQSANGGLTWTAPRRLNDDAGAAHQYHPTLAVSAGAAGDKVAVTFYDRRDDPANCLTHVYSTQSTDGGATFSANVRQTTAASNFDGNPNGPGDYSSSTPVGTGTIAFHSQHPAADFDVFAIGF